MLTASLATVFVWSTLTQASLSASGAPQVPVQSAPSTPAGTPGQQVVQLLKEGKVRFELLDDRGKRHKASLVQVQGDAVTLRTRGELLVVPADQLQRAERSGDAPWDGALIGLAAGGALLAGTVAPDPGDWTVHDTISFLSFTTAVGFVCDLVHNGRHTVLVGALRSKSASSLEVRVAGQPRDRRVQVGYRVAF
jgi:hypothetical protein